jgi:Zn-dependent protease with chaperone function
VAYVVAFATVLFGTVLAMALLARARWPGRLPRVAIVSWQALGLGLGLALIGLPLAVGLAPYGGPTVRAATRFGTDLIGGDLPEAVGRADPAAPGALVLDHPAAAAYCVPGLRSTVVVSAGAVTMLRREELAAVLSHERAHAVERHDIVLLPFTALRQALPAFGWLLAAAETVALLVEMRADDRARRQHAGALTAALRRFATAPAIRTPAGALGAAGRAIEARLQRLSDHRRPPLVRGTATLLCCSALASVPPVLFLGG